jgi:dTDP-4-amino-4,6-dideoxygalactose transaminase
MSNGTMGIEKRRAEDFALLGGSPAFSPELPVGQRYFPSTERFEAAMAGIFERGWYTNHGPLAQELEGRLAEQFAVAHAVLVTNSSIGLVMAAKALGLSGKVVVPSFTYPSTAQALVWAGVEPLFCDVDPSTGHLSPKLVEDVLDDDVTGVLAVNSFGGACDLRALERLASSRGLALLFDSGESVGSSVDGTPLGGFGALEVFSLHSNDVLSATEGGCICTNDDELAARLRNIRSSYGAGRPVPVPLTSNGRFSEAQAAIGLLSLADLPENLSRNAEIFRAYEKALTDVEGVELLAPSGVETSSHQRVVLAVSNDDFGLGRDRLVEVLRSEGILAESHHRGAHRAAPFASDARYTSVVLPDTERLASTLFQLPIGALVSNETVEQISSLLANIRRHAAAISAATTA